jgi:hypothetical protein
MGTISRPQGAACVKCGRRNFLTPSQLESGFTCPRCGTFNHPNTGKPQEEDASGKTQEQEKKEEEKDFHVECPVCRLDCLVPKERRFKLLCLCPHCDSVFVKPPRPTPPKDAAPPAEAKAVKDEAPPKKELKEEGTDVKETPPSLEPANDQPQKDEAEKEKQSTPVEPEKVETAKKEESDTQPQPTTPPTPPAKEVPKGPPPTPEQLRQLSEMQITGTPETFEAANELLSTINGIAEDAIMNWLPGFRHLHQSMRTPLIVNLVTSPIFRMVYFENETPHYEELRLLSDEIYLADQELRASLRVNVDIAVFERAVEYIEGYALFRHKLNLEQKELRVLALKSFRRGFGGRLRALLSAPPPSYGRNGLTAKQGKMPKEEMNKLFAMKSQENGDLDTLLRDCELIKKADFREGCILFAAFALAAPSLLAYFIA